MKELFLKLFQFLKDLVLWLVDKIKILLIELINLVLGVIAKFISFIADLLPSDFGLPSVSLPPALADILSQVSWFFPVSVMVTCILVYLTALMAYFPVKAFLKFVQMA